MVLPLLELFLGHAPTGVFLVLRRASRPEVALDVGMKLHRPWYTLVRRLPPQDASLSRIILRS